MTSAPLLAKTREELRTALCAFAQARVGLVPTMGALHAGHAALLARARQEVGPDAPVVASVFVNPLQFGPGEDLDRYPRTFEADLEVCAEQGVDIVFAPSVEEVYPGGNPLVTIDPGPLAAVLEGTARPRHFHGVLTVVAKLFGLVRPDVAVFGEKDYQQLTLVRRMVEDLCMGVEVVGAETLREHDGLALSSRNRYLSAEERREALALSRAVRAAEALAASGERDAARIVEAMTQELSAPGVRIDYVEVVDAETLQPVETLVEDGPSRGRYLAAVAALVGTTRLIDNVTVGIGD